MHEKLLKIFWCGTLFLTLIGCGENVSDPKNVEISSTVIGNFKDCENCPEMVVLSGDDFLMGDRDGYKYSQPYHLPMHEVKINYNIAVSKFEITNRQYNECYISGACSSHILTLTIENHELKEIYLDLPLENASWTMANDYAQWLSDETGRSYRLLSESEWEYAARAGSDTEYWWGSEMLPGYALCADCEYGVPLGTLLVVYELPMNPFGIHGMNGSVSEWVADCMNANLENLPVNGFPVQGGRRCEGRVVKGSSYLKGKSTATSSSRLFAGERDVVRAGGKGIRLASADVE